MGGVFSLDEHSRYSNELGLLRSAMIDKSVDVRTSTVLRNPTSKKRAYFYVVVATEKQVSIAAYTMEEYFPGCDFIIRLENSDLKRESVRAYFE